MVTIRMIMIMVTVRRMLMIMVTVRRTNIR
jgi:hypothetical protein